MSLNQYMHPRNPYKKPPCFIELAEEYPQFKEKIVVDEKGVARLNFKDTESLRQLSSTLLHRDFNLHVNLPTERLVPALPLRLNYLLWLEDLVAANNLADVSAIDIGTGASCIYALLGASRNKWTFRATEMDSFSFEVANSNVQANGLQHLVQVKKCEKNDPLLMNCFSKLPQLSVAKTSPDCGGVVGDSGVGERRTDDIAGDGTSSPSPAKARKLSSDAEAGNGAMEGDTGTTYTFCMCNPPFFSSNLDAWAMMQEPRKKRRKLNDGDQQVEYIEEDSLERPPPNSVSTAGPDESVTHGGEVHFVSRIIQESLLIRDKIKIYTSMLGKKSSLQPLKALLKNNKVNNLVAHELCQGKTMRWTLAWSFDPKINLSVECVKRSKKRKPLEFLVDSDILYVKYDYLLNGGGGDEDGAGGGGSGGGGDDDGGGNRVGGGGDQCTPSTPQTHPTLHDGPRKPMVVEDKNTPPTPHTHPTLHDGPHKILVGREQLTSEILENSTECEIVLIRIKHLLNNLCMIFSCIRPTQKSGSKHRLRVKANLRSWCNQRRFRRLKMLQERNSQESDNKLQFSADNIGTNDAVNMDNTGTTDNTGTNDNTGTKDNTGKMDKPGIKDNSSTSDNIGTMDNIGTPETDVVNTLASETTGNCDLVGKPPRRQEVKDDRPTPAVQALVPPMTFNLDLVPEDNGHVNVLLEFISGEDRELLHQVKQCLCNKIYKFAA